MSAIYRNNWLNSVSSVGVYTDVQDVAGATTYGLQVTSTGSSNIYLEGSIDGTTWILLLQVNSSTGIGVYGKTASQYLVKYIRLYVDGLSSGDTVSASVIAV